MKKYHLVKNLAIIKNHLYQLVSDPKFYNIGEPGLTKLKYIYDKLSHIYDMLAGVED